MATKLKEITIFLFLATLVVIMMDAGQSLLVPIAWSIIFSFIGLPVAQRLEKKKFNRIYSSLIATVFTLIIIGSVFIFLSIEATILLKEQDGLIQKLME
ncbi:MAG: hypothetical protein U5K54_00165 [Cytophagales bacterium]|nr:hypothetical protein [Cytophagales bacterium]